MNVIISHCKNKFSRTPMKTCSAIVRTWRRTRTWRHVRTWIRARSGLYVALEYVMQRCTNEKGDMCAHIVHKCVKRNTQNANTLCEKCKHVMQNAKRKCKTWNAKCKRKMQNAKSAKHVKTCKTCKTRVNGWCVIRMCKCVKWPLFSICTCNATHTQTVNNTFGMCGSQTHAKVTHVVWKMQTRCVKNANT